MKIFIHSRQVKLLLSIVITGVLMISPSCGKKTMDSAILIYKIGEVKILSSQQGERKAMLRDRITASDTIETGLNSHAALQIGKEVIFRLGPESRIQLQSLLVTGNKMMFLEKGTLLSRVSHLKKGSTFQIKTATAVAAVRGTEFSVQLDKGNARVAVRAGKVKVERVEQSTGHVLASMELVQGKSALVDKEKRGDIETADISPLEELEIQKVSIISFLDNPQSMSVKDLDNVSNQIQSQEQPIIKRIAKELEQEKPKSKGKSLNLETIKKKYKRIDEVTLYNGKVILGAIISRGDVFEILTPGGTVKVSKNEVKSTRIIQ